MSDKSDFERFWKSKPHLKAYEPMAAAWQAWQAARALEGGEADSPVMEYHNSPSGMHVVWETLPYGKHLLYIHPSASVPEGWNIEMIGDEIRIDTPDDAHFQFARDSRMPNHALPNMLYDLGSALLTTPTPATTPETEWVPASVITPEIIDWVCCGMATNGRHKEQWAVDMFRQFRDSVANAKATPPQEQ